MVSIHAPARGATEYLIGLAPLVAFQSTPLREGRLMISPTLSATRGFNPRPCARGDRKNVPPPCGETVSIHAPARGATHNKNNRDLTDFVSIHAPARGATLEEKQLILAKVVSIHAPARGATDTITKRRSKSWVSIHAPARGATPIKIVFAGIFKFQSTPLREGRRSW